MREWSLRDALGADSAVHKRGNGARFEGVLEEERGRGEFERCVGEGTSRNGYQSLGFLT